MIRILVLFLGALAFAQTENTALRSMEESKAAVTAYLERCARRITDRAASEIRTREEWEHARARRLEEMRDMLGLLPWPERTRLNIKITNTLDKGSYVIENIAFESVPKFYVTANLYLPKNRPGKAPAVIYVCGHAMEPHGSKAAYQRHGISLAKNGYAAMIIDPIQIAETFGVHHGIHSQEMYDWYSRGYTPAGVEVWNAMRAIDYLETRPEIDADRIGMTGRSGGAAMTWFTAAVDPRVKVAAPVMGISTYAANVQLNTQRGHCDCMFTINALLHDMMHQGALIAPRPLLMAHGKLDNLFPVPGYEEFEAKVGGLYSSYGEPTGFRNIVVETGHKDSDFLREEVIRWFDRYLMRIPERKLDMDYSNAAPESLAVFPGGPPDDAQNYRIQDTFLPTPQLKQYTSRAAWETHRSGVVGTLRRKVFAAFPHTAADLRVRRSLSEPPPREQELDFESEEGITVRAVYRRHEKPGKYPALLYVASDGEDARSINAVFRSIAPRMVVYPRGVGEIPWPKSFWKDTLRNAMHVGHTVDSMRLWDVMRAVQVLRLQDDVDPGRIMVVGRGVSGALGLYAAVLDPQIHQVTLIDPPVTHVQGPIFLNVLRYLDLPEAAAMIAPRHLNFYARIPKEFESARQVFELYGKPENLFLTMNFDKILEGRYDHGFASGL